MLHAQTISAQTRLKVAIVHDWLTTMGGAEKVLDCFLELYPQADLYTLVSHLDPQKLPHLQHRKIHTSFIQKLPFSKRFYRNYLPLMPLAIEHFDLSQYDLILSSSYAVAKGALRGPNQTHICYCHSPIRYAWDLQHQYLSAKKPLEKIKSFLAHMLLHKIRIWDICSSNNVDYFIGNSQFVARRIQKYYRRESIIIYPPVDIDAFQMTTEKSNYYLTASRLVPYKRVDLIVDTFKHLPEQQLVVIGNGPEYEKIRSQAPQNVTFLGEVNHDILAKHMQSAKAFIFAAEEDFGITPVEAQACGTPVIAYGKGGCLESIKGVPAKNLNASNNPTGIYFEEQSIDALAHAIQQFENNQGLFSAKQCRMNATRFDRKHFLAAITTTVEAALSNPLKDTHKPSNHTIPNSAARHQTSPLSHLSS